MSNGSNYGDDLRRYYAKQGLDLDHLPTRQERREARKAKRGDQPLDNRKSIRLIAELAGRPKKGTKS